jgi:hypothetical protein
LFFATRKTTASAKEEGVIRKERCAIIQVDLFATASIPLAIKYGWQHGRFLIDRKVWCQTDPSALLRRPIGFDEGPSL